MTIREFCNGQAVFDHLPGVAAIVAAMNAAMLLAEHHAGVARIVLHAVHALARRGWRRVDRRIDAFVLRLPRLAAVGGAEEAGGRNADPHAVRILRVAQDRVRAKAAKAWRPIFSPRLFVEPV